MSSPLPWGIPSAMSKRTTSPSSFKPMRWASVPPICPAPTSAIFFRAMGEPRSERQHWGLATQCWFGRNCEAEHSRRCECSSSREALLGEFPHHLDQVRLALKADPRDVGHDDMAVLHPHPVWEAAIRLEEVRIAFIAAEPKARRDVQRHLMAAMRNATARRPTCHFQHLQRALILAKAVRQSAVELQPVSVRAHPTVPQEIARVLVTEEVLSGRHGAGIEFCERCLKGEVERIADLLVPEQGVLTQHFGVCDPLFEREAAIRVDAELRPSIQVSQHPFDAGLILLNAIDRKSTRLNSSHMSISYAVFCLKKK